VKAIVGMLRVDRDTYASGLKTPEVKRNLLDRTLKTAYYRCRFVNAGPLLPQQRPDYAARKLRTGYIFRKSVF
jgi:hypothetical protein